MKIVLILMFVVLGAMTSCSSDLEPKTETLFLDSKTYSDKSCHEYRCNKEESTMTAKVSLYQVGIDYKISYEIHNKSLRKLFPTKNELVVRVYLGGTHSPTTTYNDLIKLLDSEYILIANTCEGNQVVSVDVVVPIPEDGSIVTFDLLFEVDKLNGRALDAEIDGVIGVKSHGRQTMMPQAHDRIHFNINSTAEGPIGLMQIVVDGV